MSTAPVTAVRDAGSSVRAVASHLGLPAVAFLEETGSADPAGGLHRGRARPLAAAALEWVSAVVLVIGCLTDLGASARLCCPRTSGDLGRPWGLP
ncbi:hypothetical protein NDU88_004495 [Pleurodeles waltl]|uniref:Uncharacterized protein n=1 Tax=Pleurodeles waltl TaxID=8319 RepID=A0AAV7SIX2_PLEWA|nr:hypothetical protein NDU88_004495 [Pleurodeles waltl]